MDGTVVLQQVVNGIISGSIYVLVGMGLSQIFGILGISHFAHGSVVMIGSYVAYTFARILGMPWIFAALMAVIASVILGLLIERYAYRVIQNGPAINVFIVALGLMFIFENIAQIIWGPEQVAIITPSNVSVSIGPVRVTLFRIYMFIANLLLMGLLALVMKKTKLGRSIRAVAQNREAAAMVGVNVNRTNQMVFGIGSALAGICGVFMATVSAAYPVMGGDIVLKGFAVMILGGLGSIPGVVIGGGIIGLVESLGATFISTAFKDAFGFIIIILVLIFKPTGLLGKKAAN